MGAQATTGSAVVFETDDADGQLYEAGMGVVGRSDGIETGLEAVGQFEEFLGRILHVELTHDVNVISGPQVVLNGLGVGGDGLDLGSRVV